MKRSDYVEFYRCIMSTFKEKGKINESDLVNICHFIHTDMVKEVVKDEKKMLYL